MDNNLITSKSSINYGVRIKLLLGFLVVLLLTALVGIVGYYGVYKINQEAEDLGDHWLKATTSLAKVIEDTEDTRRYLLGGFLMRSDAQAFQGYKTQFAIIKVKWEQDFTEYNKYVTTPEGIAKSEEMRKSFDTFIEDADQVWMLTQVGKDVEARPILTQKSKESFDQLLKDMEEQMVSMAAGGAAATHHAETTKTYVDKLLMIFVVLAVFVGAVLSYLLAQHISKPLVAVTKVAQSVAEGDLSMEIQEVKNKDEIGVLSQAVREMVHSLRAVIGEVLTQSESVAATSEELSAASEEATASSEQMAESLGLVASSSTRNATSMAETVNVIEELSANAQLVAKNAETVSQSSEKAAQAAELGAFQAENAVLKIEAVREVSAQSAEVISRLGDESKQIGQIVDVIRGIADQTNLLALNAAIEAARAGEQGRGFAVVAEEVRKLAEQSSSSTVQIANLIENIQRETEIAIGVMEKGKVEVAAGVEAVNLAGSSFQTIVAEVNQVVRQIEQITEATQQMAVGTSAAAQSIEDIGLTSQQAASSSQEVAAASEEQAATMVSVSKSAEALAALGDKLMSAVVKFKL